MGVYVKNMEMPTSCYKCQLRRRDGMDIVCPVAHERFSVADVNILEYRLDNCPLVPVPPHDRLIEYHAACHAVYDGYKEFGLTWRNAEVMLGKLPTIIPAEEGE